MRRTSRAQDRGEGLVLRSPCAQRTYEYAIEDGASAETELKNRDCLSQSSILLCESLFVCWVGPGLATQGTKYLLLVQLRQSGCTKATD